MTLRKLPTVAVVAGLLGLCGCGGAGDRPSAPPRVPEESGPGLEQFESAVSRTDHGDEWPLTVEDGVVACLAGAMTFATGAKRYALNDLGVARSTGEAIVSIQARDSRGRLRDLTPLLDAANDLC